MKIDIIKIKKLIIMGICLTIEIAILHKLCIMTPNNGLEAYLGVIGLLISCAAIINTAKRIWNTIAHS